MRGSCVKDIRAGGTLDILGEERGFWDVLRFVLLWVMDWMPLMILTFHFNYFVMLFSISLNVTWYRDWTTWNCSLHISYYCGGDNDNDDDDCMVLFLYEIVCCVKMQSLIFHRNRILFWSQSILKEDSMKEAIWGSKWETDAVSLRNYKLNLKEL